VKKQVDSVCESKGGGGIWDLREQEQEQEQNPSRGDPKMKRVSDVFDIIWGDVCYGMDYRRVWEIKERLYYNLQLSSARSVYIYIYIYILFSFSHGCFYGICGAKWFTRV
jgi:hypothetical protein